MRSLPGSRIAGPLLVAFALTVPAPAAADIIVSYGVSNLGTDNVLLTAATNAGIVTGTFDSGHVTVDFESDGGNLNADASGQAVITTAHYPFTDISFYLADGSLFSKAVFNINAAIDGTVLITVTGLNLPGGAYEGLFAVDGNGQNFFTIDAGDFEMLSIGLIAQGDLTFQDLRQVRIGGAEDPIQAVPVPEPGSMLLLASGLIAAGGSAWRRRRRS